MLKTFLLSTLFISIVLCTNATVYYVNSVQPNNLGNGLSWANAKKDVQNAINLAVTGDSVWVAAGTYLPTDYPPTTTTPLPARAKTIFVTDGVKIYGGFSGTETGFSQRNILTNIAILSGDFAGNDGVTGSGNTLAFTGTSENAFHVVLAVPPLTGGNGIVVDGFRISGGNSNSSFSLVINGITINSNYGAGVCIVNNSNSYTNTSIIANNVFQYNESNFRASVLYLEKGKSQLQNNTITLNKMKPIVADSSMITGNTIINNLIFGNWSTSSVGEGLLTGNYDTLSNNIFKGNLRGYVIKCDYSIIHHNLIDSNINYDYNTFWNYYICGGIYGNYTEIYNNKISNNKARDGGGIMGSHLNIYNNTISYNVVSTGNTLNSIGGGIRSAGNCKIKNNIVIGNAADQGGGIEAKNNDTIINNLVYSNYGDHFLGGGVNANGTNIFLANNTFYNNGAEGLANNGTLVVENCIFWQNDIINYLSSNVLYNNCSFPYPISHYSFVGSGNYDLGVFASNNLFSSNPQFVDSSNIAGVDGIYRTFDDGLRLKSISPCLNSGLTGFGIPTIDILGTSRPQGVGIDMGAYEKVFCASVSLPINITTFSNLNICNGFPTTLSVSSVQPSDSIFWYADSTSISSLGNGYNFTTNILTATDTFWVSAHNCDSSSGRLAIIVHVNPIITISATPNDTVCAGSPIILTASGANTYSWTGGITNGISFTPIASTTYTVTATDINGCIKTSTQSITLLSIPAINITASPNDSICAGATATLTATGASTYTWSGGITNGINFTPTASNTYTVTATALNGCTNTNTQSITVNSLPIINITTLPNDTICAGSSLSLTATGGSTYSWSGSITNATPFTPTASSTYTVTVTSSYNCSNTSTQSITLNPLPTININVLPNDTVCAGTALTINANGASTYSWSGGITNASPFTPAASNTYTVTATGSNSCTNTATQSIVVKPLISPSISITPSITQGITGDPITYTATTNVPSPYSIDWYRNLALSNTSIINTWNTAIIAGVNNIYAVIKSPTNCLSPDSAKSSSLSILNVTGLSTLIPQGFSIYPNPSENQVVIDGLLKNDKISLYNSLGQLIFSDNNLDFKPKTINVESYSAGIYIFFFERNNQRWQVKFEKR